MQKDASRIRKANAGTRRSSGASSEKSGRGIWEWQTSTGVFETRITEEQLAQLEASQLTILDAPKEPSAVSYYEWREQSRTASQPVEPKSTDGAIKRWFKRIVQR